METNCGRPVRYLRTENSKYVTPPLWGTLTQSRTALWVDSDMSPNTTSLL